ncbi:hypothetical protein [Umezakia ovalisporum]|uniref:hypothetical protein n=1 Tax=Umezakia ovalisporum TaxID=75695 RepID=UPI0035B7A997
MIILRTELIARNITVVNNSDGDKVISFYLKATGLLRERKSTQEFISYTRHRDPMSMGWQFSPEDGLYYPVS